LATTEAAELGNKNSHAGEFGFAARYAAALYALAFEAKKLDQVVDEMAALGRLIAETADLRRFIGTPLTDAATAAPVIKSILAAQKFSELVQNFVAVVIANRRLRDLPVLVAGFAAYVARKRGEIVADVASAHALTDVQRTQLRARLTESGYSNARLMETVDPALLGGMVLKIGPRIYDTSLRSRLQRLNHSLKGAA
jgi:F-type H+-transporting ATPase subunit delta